MEVRGKRKELGSSLHTCQGYDTQMLLIHGLSYGPALTRNTKERTSVCQSDQVGLRPPRCCFSNSGYWLPTRKKILGTVANPACSLLNREKKKKRRSLTAPPSPPATLLIRRKNKIKPRDASTCLGARQVGVTQVSVRLAPVQGFLRLVG